MKDFRLRQVHLDFHTSPLIPDVGSKFDKKEWQKTLLSTIWTFFLTLPVMFWYFYETCPYAVIANIIRLR